VYSTLVAGRLCGVVVRGSSGGSVEVRLRADCEAMVKNDWSVINVGDLA